MSKDPGARAQGKKKSGNSKQTRAPRMVASNAIRTTIKLENPSSSSAPTARTPTPPPPPPPPVQQNVDRNPLDDIAMSSEEMDEAESSDYQQSSEGPSDSEYGDDDYQPGGMISGKRNQTKNGPSHNAGRPVTGASRQKASGQNNGNQNAASQNTAGHSGASQRTTSQRAASQNAASQNTDNQNDNQIDEDEIVLSRDHPQEERCLPYRTTSRMSKRQIISWDANIYTLSLLSLIWILEVKDYPVPWQELAAIVNPGATGESFKQAMVKLRNRRIADGHRVPPARPGNNHPRHQCQMELEEILRNAGVPTGPLVPGYGGQDIQVVEDPSIAERRAAAPVDGGRSVGERSAAAEKANSASGAQRSNGNGSRMTTQQSQLATQPEPSATREGNRDLSVIHHRSLTSAQQESRDAPTRITKPSLIFVADIGAQKALLNFNKKEQKLISDVTHNLVNGCFAQPPTNPVFFLDQITALSSGVEDPPSPYNSEDSDPENLMARMRRQQKRKRNGASTSTSQSSPKLTGVVATADCDIQIHPNKKIRRGNDFNSPSSWQGEDAGGSKKRKHDEADMGDLSPGTADDWMFNPDYAVPAGESIPLGSFVKTDTTWENPTLRNPFLNSNTHHAEPYSHHNLNLALSASPALHPRGRTGGSLTNSAGTANTNQQPLPMEDMGIDTGMDMDVGMGMPSAGNNYSEEMCFDQQMNWTQGFNDPFMDAGSNTFDPGLDDPFTGEGPGTLDYSLSGPSMGTSSHKSKYSLGGIASDKDKDLLSSTSQWQSGDSPFGPSQTERRLSGLPPIPGDSDYGQNMEPYHSLDMEHHRHQNRGMLNDTSIEQDNFDPNSFANEAFARMDTTELPKPEDDGL